MNDFEIGAPAHFRPKTLERSERVRWGGGCQMADRPEREKILEVAVSGIPQIAKVIADFPIEFQEGAFEVAERRYQQTAI